VNLYVDALILDSVDLPEALPSPLKSEGVPRPMKRISGEDAVEQAKFVASLFGVAS
jgi:hypothetical protein